jgi:gluconolactonase
MPLMHSANTPVLIRRVVGLALCCVCLGSAAQAPYPRDASIAGIPNVIAANARWELAWEGTNNADGLVGLPDGSVLFAQEQPRLVGRLDAANRYSVYLSETHGVGSLSIDREGRLLGVERTCTDPGRRSAEPCVEPPAVSVIAPARSVLADTFEGATLGRLNDLVVSTSGAVYFTVGGAYYVGASGRVSSFGTDLRANGIMLSPDERTLYVTNGNTIVAFTIGEGGKPADGREFATLEAGGTGDGMAIDDEGRLYVTSAPGVQVFPTPRNAISVAFAGTDKHMLYVVGSGAALGPDGSEFTTREGTRNNAKTIYRLPMIARGFAGRAK